MKARIVLQSIAAAVAVMAAGVASATPIYPDFTVNTTAMGGGGTLVPFTANDISGQYQEQLHFNADGTFNVDLAFTAQGFNYDDTNPALSTSFTAKQTGLTNNYNLFALFSGSGNWSTDASGTTTFSLNSGGAISLVYDLGANDQFFTPPAAPGAGYQIINVPGDVLTTLGSGKSITGSGTESCTAPNLCGDFGQSNSLALNSFGSSFFVSPVPFYSVTLESGQFEGFPVVAGQTVTSNGTVNIVMGVPEPAGVALVGIALLGLGLAAKRRRSV